MTADPHAALGLRAAPRKVAFRWSSACRPALNPFEEPAVDDPE